MKKISNHQIRKDSKPINTSKKSNHPWIYRSALPVIIAIGGTVLAYAVIDKIQSNLPQTQTINDSLTTSTYAYAYDWRTKGPLWVAQVVNVNNSKIDEKVTKFSEDSKVPAIMRFNESSYKNSGFIIEQLLDTSGMELEEITLSTTSPQLPEFNQGLWKKLNIYVTNSINELAVKKVLVISGPLYLPNRETKEKCYVSYQVIGEDNIAVPTHFFKAIFYQGDNPQLNDVASEIYILPNEDLSEAIPLESFKISVGDFEKKSGLIFPDNILDYLISVYPGGR